MNYLKINPFIKPNLNTTINLINSTRQYTTEFYPYTSALYKKNYIKYQTQSKLTVTHDYVYHGDERLPSLEERLKELNNKEKTRINKLKGLLNLKDYKREIAKKIQENKNSKQLELDSRELKIKIPLDELNKQIKIIDNFRHIEIIAEHYNIYKDLFVDKYFRPVLDLNVKYKDQAVYYGNKIRPEQASNSPQISFEDILNTYDKDQTVYHSLVFVNLDGNFNDSEHEVLHWLIGNIKNGDMTSGKEFMDYLQPFPMRGTGWHRCVYVLFEHITPIEFESDIRTNENKFSRRDFKFSNFYTKYQDKLTPVGLSFFQSEWDLSVKNLFHNYFDMQEPSYEFKFETKFVPKFEKHPKDYPPFNWYLQEYMDKKDVNEHVMKDYIKDITPFDYYPEPAKYPIIDLKTDGHRWHKYEVENKRKRKLQFSIIPFKYFSPTVKIDEQIKNLPYQQKE